MPAPALKYVLTNTPKTGVGAFAVTLNRTPITLNGQTITLTRAA